MKLAILLLVCSFVLVLSRPDGSKELKPVGEGSNESKNSHSGESNDSSNESGNGSGSSNPLQLLLGSQQVEKLLDLVVKNIATNFGITDITSIRGLIARLQSNPIGSLIWKQVSQPITEYIENVQKGLSSTIDNLPSLTLPIPNISAFPPIQLAQAIIHYVFAILTNVANIFNSNS